MLAGLIVSVAMAGSGNNEPFSDLVARCAPTVHVTTMAAVVRHESQFRPLAIGINHTRARLPRQPSSKAEAVATAQWLDANGYNYDSGLGQVNSKNRAWLGMSYDDLFDPCANLKGAARILSDCWTKAQGSGLAGQAALHGALSCYATGNLQRGIANGYVQSVANMAVIPVPALLDGTRPARASKGAPTPSEDQQPTPTSDDPPVELKARPVRHNGEPDVFGQSDGEVFVSPAPNGDAGKGASPQ